MAIDARELRIGNWVMFSPSGKKDRIKPRPVKILELLQKSAITEDNGLPLELFYGSVSIQPIPLTTEILEKCGFKERNIDTMFPYWEIRHTRINGLVEYVFKISTMGDDEWRWIEGNVNVPIYYVHELQNLIYEVLNNYPYFFYFEFMLGAISKTKG